MPNQMRPAAYPGYPSSPAAPNAALLIDFDNVTVSIRGDLGKELKALLNSDVIRGKVAVQRAYADWRRYPQYIVPLAESSVDLIFAPAYGPQKKNATDLRMAIDAVELVFTRPEIGTFILLTGDSDFSSCVLKLKEYGKYVIGVGMREAASDLLIQNCDEYYSYHSLSGLTREGEVVESSQDPWALVQRAAEQMVENNDVMRADRLKQVMLGLDPHFDEKKLGYSKFSRFVSEAAKKGLLRTRKTEHGQHEIILEETERAEPAAPRPRGRVGRGGRERARPEPAPVPQVVPAAPAPRAEAPAPDEQSPAAPLDLNASYALLQQAIRDLGNGQEGVRDGDVKRRMLDMAPDFDEGAFGFPKFSRYLRQAHDDEVVDLERIGTSRYQVSLPKNGKQLPPPTATAPAAPRRESEVAATTSEAPAAAPAPSSKTAAAAAPTGALRGRRRGGAAEGPPPLLPGQVVAPPSSAPEAAPKTTPKTAARARSEAAEPVQPTAGSETVAGETAESGQQPTKPRRGRGRRGGGAAEGPPPVLPGQVVEASAPKRGRSRQRRKEEPVRKGAGKKEALTFSAAALGLPTEREAIERYLANSYRGTGKKTAESLLDAAGPDIFRVMQEEPERVRELLSARRADALLEQWNADYERRREEQSTAAPATPASEEQAETAEEQTLPKETRPRSRRGSRGGRRGRSPKKQEPVPA